MRNFNVKRLAQRQPLVPSKWGRWGRESSSLCFVSSFPIAMHEYRCLQLRPSGATDRNSEFRLVATSPGPPGPPGCRIAPFTRRRLLRHGDLSPHLQLPQCPAGPQQPASSLPTPSPLTGAAPPPPAVPSPRGAPGGRPPASPASFLPRFRPWKDHEAFGRSGCLKFSKKSVRFN